VQGENSILAEITDWVPGAEAQKAQIPEAFNTKKKKASASALETNGWLNGLRSFGEQSGIKQEMMGSNAVCRANPEQGHAT